MKNKSFTVQFDIIKLSDNNKYVDPNSISINGYIHSWLLLEEFLFSKDSILFTALLPDVDLTTISTTIEVELYLEYDDDGSWLDYKSYKIL